MTVSIEFHGTTAEIFLAGNIDYSTQEVIREVNRQALSNAQVKEIRVDCAEVTFLDSSAIRALLILQKEANAQGQTVVLLNCSNNTREVFEIGGFDRMFNFL